MTREVIFKEALQLDPADRAELIDVLWSSFGDDEQAPELTPAQRQDLQARIKESDAGLSNPIPWEVARERLRKRS